LGCVKLHTDYYKDKSLKGLSLVWRNDENLKTHTVDYRFGFNGKEQDSEVSGQGNTIAFEARIYDSRLGRFFSTDPREAEYGWQSTYAYYKNSPISTQDILGMGGDNPVTGNRAKRKVRKFDKALSKMAKETGNGKLSADNFDDVHDKYKNKRWYWNKTQHNTNNSGVKAGNASVSDVYSVREIYEYENWSAINAARGIVPPPVVTPIATYNWNFIPIAGITNLNSQSYSFPRGDVGNTMQITALSINGTATGSLDQFTINAGPIRLAGPAAVSNINDGIATGNIPIPSSGQFTIDYVVNNLNATAGPTGLINWTSVALNVTVQTSIITNAKNV
jgi:RHS repeat-associated protein